MMEKSRTYIATPPGATIKEQLLDRGMNQKEFAARMDMSEKHISRLINGDVILTPETALRLEMVLGIPASFWNNLEARYREKLILVHAENEMDEDLEIAAHFPFREMQANGWVEKASTSKEKVMSLRKFFEVTSLRLLSEPLIPNIACRRQTVTTKADYALLAWAQKAKLDARQCQTKPINLQKLENYLPQIRGMTSESPSDFAPRLCSMFAECGIALVFLPHISGSFLHGATFYDKNKIVIGLTVRGKDADKFWFSLFHEVGHILLGHINNINGTSDADESAADSFATDILISEKDFEEFIEMNRFTQASIISFANQIGIDAGIVVGRLQKEGYVNYNRFNKLKSKYEIS